MLGSTGVGQHTHTAYRPDIDGLRAIAIASVVLFHAFPRLLSGGFVGVDIFFVISGYVISTNIFRTLDQGTFSFKGFYVRRVRRIFPALSVVLLFSLLLGWSSLLPDEFRIFSGNILASVAYIINIKLCFDVNYFSPSADMNPLLHLWSLSLEEQFYILFPALSYILYKRRRNLVYIIVIFGILSFGLNVLRVEGHSIGTFYLPLTRFWEILLGAGVAAWSAQWFDKPQWCDKIGLGKLGGIGAPLGLAMILAAFVLLDRDKVFPGWWAILPTVGAALLIVAGPHRWINRVVLSSQPFVFLGLISYPLYLWHWVLLSFSRVLDIQTGPISTPLAAVGASVLLAYGTYRWVECPIRFGSLRGRVSIPVLASVSVALGAVGLLGATNVLLPYSSGVDAKISKIYRAIGEWGYPGKVATDVDFNGTHLYRLGSGPKVVLFIGDSNMEQYFPRIEALSSAGRLQRFSSYFLTAHGCPPIPAVEDRDHPQCQGLTTTALDFIRQNQVDRVVVGGSWWTYFDFGSFYTTVAGQKLDLKSPDGRIEAMASLQQFLQQIRQQGPKLSFILNMPIGVTLDPRQMIIRGPFSFKGRQGSVSRHDLDAHFGEISLALRHAATEAGAEVIDPLESLCSGDSCPSLTGDGEPIYVDGSHLRPTFMRDHGLFLDGFYDEG